MSSAKYDGGVDSARDEGASAADSVASIGSTTDEEVAGADSAAGVGSAIDEGAVVTGPALTGSSSLELSTDTVAGSSLPVE